MNRIKLVFLSIIITFSTFSFSQTKVGIGFSPFNAGAFFPKKLIGASTNDVLSSNALSLQVLKTIDSNLEFEVGIDYTLFYIETSAAVIDPEIETSSYESQLAIIQVPLAIRYNADQYFFLSGGVLLDFDTNSTAPVSSQSGVGLLATAGFQYPFSNGVALYVNPFLKFHSLIPFSNWNNHQKLVDRGVKIGLSYSF